MNINIEINEKELKTLIYNHLREMLGDIPLDIKNINILVKSKQNYRSEWENANFKAIFHVLEDAELRLLR